jgi:hypothetical protein
MNEISKSLIVLFLAFFIGSYFGIDFAQAHNNELVLEITQKCDIQYAGNSCVIDLKFVNNTDEILDGTAFLHIDYQGVCGDGFFDGEGIEAQFSIDDANWLNFSNWDNGTATVSGFEIPKAETQPKLKMETIPALCPGKYIFTLTIKGTAETGEEYVASPITLGSVGGGGLPLGLTIQYENSQVATTTATITWLTSYKSTSRVIYDIVPGQFNLSDGEPGYGYTYYTNEFDTPANPNGVTGHSITITGLTSGTTYYYRTVSHASPDTIGTEHSFTTLGVADDTSADASAEATAPEEGDDGAGDGDTGGAGDTGDGDTGEIDTGDTGGDTSGTGDTGAGAGAGAGEEEFEYGDHIYEHKGEDDLLSIIDDEFGDEGDDDSKFLASIAAFFGDLEGWRLALMFLLGIILALIILRLIKSRIDRNKHKQ